MTRKKNTVAVCVDCRHLISNHRWENFGSLEPSFNCNVFQCVCSGTSFIKSLKEQDLLKTPDPISPAHYSQGMPEGVEVRDVIKAQGLWREFCNGNLIKYVLRHKHKNGLEDLKKARQYIDWLIEDMENENNNEG